MTEARDSSMTDDLERLMRTMLYASTDDFVPVFTDPALCAQWVRDNLYELIAACIEVDVEQTGPLEVTITSELPPYDMLESRTVDPNQ